MFRGCLVILTITSLIGTCRGVTCYKCDDCNYVDDRTEVHGCPDGKCVNVIFRYHDDPPDRERHLRSCGHHAACTRLREKVAQGAITFVLLDCLMCDTDLCNGDYIPRISSRVLLFVVLLYLIL